ncbi:MAG: hypothetical protein AB7R40_23255 [Nitrospiraceae bacterium]
MRKGQRDIVTEAVASVDKSGARSFVPVLEALDTVVRTAARAMAAADKATGSLASAVLRAIREAPGAGAMLAGLVALRSLYAAEDARYNLYNVYLTRVRGAFRRVAGSSDPEAWAREWPKIQAAASAAPNFTQFERGTEPAPVLARPRAPGRTEVPYDTWPEEHRAIYSDLVALCEDAISKGVIPEDVAQGILSTFRGGVTLPMSPPGEIPTLSATVSPPRKTASRGRYARVPRGRSQAA